MNKSFIIFASLLALLMVLTVMSLSAHEDGEMKYPYECCHDQDCAPVKKVESVTDPSNTNGLPLTVVTVMLMDPHSPTQEMRDYTFAIPPDMQIRESMDNRMHACANVYLNPPKPLCFFVPPGN